MMEEIWKDIEGYEGFYQVSNLGRVRSVERRLNDGRIYGGRILCQKQVKNGYMQVHVSKGNTGKYLSVHRLVAKAFVQGYFDGAEVNHRDEDKTNNRADNLEWCSPSYNTQYGNSNTTMVEQRRLEVVMMSEDGSTIREFPSLREAARSSGVSAAHICQVCKGERNKAGGYRWKYKE
jgi:hypothetical protein